jgi:hypothetical protein
MWKIVNAQTGDDVAQLHFNESFEFSLLTDNEGVRSALEHARDGLTQLNRTVEEDPDPPERLVKDEGASPNSWGEAWQEPSDDYLLGTIARRVRPGHRLVHEEEQGSSGSDPSGA